MSANTIVILGNARSGTTYLQELLMCHRDVDSVGEPLNSEVITGGDPFEDIDKVLSQPDKPVVVFKCFPEQLLELNIRLNELLRHLRCTSAVVVWRRDLLEMFVSRKIADMTNVWYSRQPANEVVRVHIDEEEYLEFVDNVMREWAIMGTQWPIEVAPIFFSYEEICENGPSIAASILTDANLDLRNTLFKCPMERQNPWPLSEKVSNWDQLSEKAKNVKLDVARVLSEAIFNSIPGSREFGHLLPHREPPIPAGGWRYRVAEPYVPPEAHRNVVDALNARCLSSASHWTRELARRLRAIFGVPVAQPCANGFTALVLAMQAAGIEPGDEVIVPAFTMIAVPNSVHFVGAIPVLVDNACGQYNPGLSQIVDVATEKTKAVIVSHTYGVPMQDIVELAQLCRQRKWILIEDIAETVGIRERTTGKLLGTFGDFACASMYANKLVHAGDGGFVLANNPKCDGRLASLTNHGFTKSFHFLHLEPAINAKINGLGAALAAGVLERLDDIMAHRKAIAEQYRRRLSSTRLRQMPECGLGDTPWVFGVLCDTRAQRNALRRHLAQQGVETRDYFLPVHLQPCSAKMNGSERRIDQKFPVAEKLGSTGVYLPFFTDLTSDDVDYICDATVSFFNQRHPIREAPRRPVSHAVSIRPGELLLEGVEFDGNGRPVKRGQRAHPLVHAVMLRSQLEQHMVTERWDDRQKLIADIRDCVENCSQWGLNTSITFEPLLEYLRIDEDTETERTKPWLDIDIASGDFAPFAGIPTTTDPETLQFLPWLIEKSGSKRILELGPWMGRATGIMGPAVLRNAKRFVDDRQPIVYALDGFRWQVWMNHYYPEAGLGRNDSFLPLFRQNLRDLGDLIRPVEWNADIALDGNGWFPHDAKFDLIFIDFTEEPNELLIAMRMLRKHCVRGNTLFVFNGFVQDILPFYFATHQEFKPIQYKPRTSARAFLYVGLPADGSDEEVDTVAANPTLKRKMKMLDSPEWDHHHKNAFGAAMDALREHLHDDHASTLFLPSIDHHLCDNTESIIGRDWTDSIPFHFQASCIRSSIINVSTPDLHRLCTDPRYRPILATCRGLFTLTEFQARYLRANLPRDLAIPVSSLTYPSILDDANRIPSKLADPSGDESDEPIQLAFIGSFARDIDLFYEAQVPGNVRKTLVAGDEQLKQWAQRAPPDVRVLDRLSDTEYEELLSTSIAFLSLTSDGAANTLVVECVARGTPILAPRWSDACREYLGDGYPLFYDQDRSIDQQQPIDLCPLLTSDKITAAIAYLSNLDKTKFRVDSFVSEIANSAVMLNVVPTVNPTVPGLPHMGARPIFPKFDITISVCCYKRTQHLAALLDRLWNGQKSFEGSIQIIVWNNNDNRGEFVSTQCRPYLIQPSETRRLDLIQSSQNYYCVIRTCIASLMQSDRLLICDDDIVPEEDFVRFFYTASQRYPEDVLCVRGHRFTEHTFDPKAPGAAWNNYDGLRFVDDQKPMQFVHFAHADACLIPRMALREWGSVEMPDPTFALVDDYWMSFVLNHKFGRNLRKLCTKDDCDRGDRVLHRTEDSDQVGLALHTRAEVLDARLRLYMHHMLMGWPKWPREPSIDEWTSDRVDAMKLKKHAHWKRPFVGYNVSSRIAKKDADDLVRMGIEHVRIGAIGVRKERDYELSGFNTKPQRQMEDLLATIDMLGQRNINVVITLSPQIDLLDAWLRIAKNCWHRPNVIGYDLINEPSTDMDKGICWVEIAENTDAEDHKKLFDLYHQLIVGISEFDRITPIMIEPPFWAHGLALPRLKLFFDDQLAADVRERILVSFHFYDPPKYNRRTLNQSRYTYPGTIPLYSGEFSPCIELNQAWIRQRFEDADRWVATCKKSPYKAVIGEFGVCRDSPGAQEYLEDTLREALRLDMPVFVFGFRDIEWEAMDYELGVEYNEGTVAKAPSNALMDVIEKAIGAAATKAKQSKKDG